jgi:ethanolamine ammonia-lyase large subunit
MTLLGVAGCNYFMGVPGADDVMLHYQSSSFHDALYLRQVLGLRPAPEFEAWLEAMGLMHDQQLLPVGERHRLLEGFLPEGKGETSKRRYRKNH